MKQSIFTLIFLATGIFSLSAQSVLKEGTITYTVSIDGDIEGIPPGMTDNMTMVMSFKGNKFRSDMNMGMIQVSNISDKDKKEGLILMNLMGMKNASRLNEVQEEAYADKKHGDYTVELSDEKKVILGYACKKAVIKSEGGNIIIYFTDEILPNNMGPEYSISEIKGFPLLIKTSTAGINISIEASKLEKKANADFSTVVPDGYNEMDYAILENMMR
jgi:GLPGLI family protein